MSVLSTTAARRALLAAAAAVAGLVAGCGGDGGDGGDRASATSGSAATPVVGPTSPAGPALTSLSDSATCADYLAATGPARENATRAALIVVRHDAGVEREPPGDVRADFEEAVDKACAERRSSPMLEVMAAVAGDDRDAYLE